MVAFLNTRDRRRRGDDLQRVRAGARGDEPGHGRALQARGPQRHRLERLPAAAMLQDAIFVREAWLDRGAATATSRSASSAPRSRAGSTAATTRTTASSTRPMRARQLGAGPPGLDDERDQRAGLAVAGRRRACSTRSVWNQTVQVAKQAGIIKQDPSHDGLRHLDRRRGPRGHRGRHQGRHVRQGNRRGHARRQLIPADPNSTDGRSREGPAVVIHRRGVRPRPYTRGAGVASGSG